MVVVENNEEKSCSDAWGDNCVVGQMEVEGIDMCIGDWVYKGSSRLDDDEEEDGCG